jgi:hypothetical protein
LFRAACIAQAQEETTEEVRLGTFEWNGVVWQVMQVDVDYHMQPFAYPNYTAYVTIRGGNECMFCGDRTGITVTVKAIARGARLTFFACGNCAFEHGLHRPAIASDQPSLPQ